MARRSARLVALAVASVSLVPVAACSSIDELLELETRIERQGYEVSNVFHEDFGTGRNEVQIEAETGRGLPPPEGQDEIAEVVWDTYPRRFDTVLIRLDDDPTTFTRGQLQERFGPRPARLDEREFSDDVNDTVRNLAYAALVGLVVTAVAAVVVVLVVRRRRKRRPPMLPPPPGMPPPVWRSPPPPPPPPPSAPPPGWSPPPPPSPPVVNHPPPSDPPDHDPTPS